MLYVIAFLIMILTSLLNRVRGDDTWMRHGFDPLAAKRIPGRALFYVTPAMFLVAWMWQPWSVALAFAAGYFFWAVWPWGFILAQVGGVRPIRYPHPVEKALLKLPGATLPLFARMLFILPACVAVAYLTGSIWFWLAALAFAVAATIVYRILFRPISSYDWLRAELAVGYLWGVLFLIA